MAHARSRSRRSGSLTILAGIVWALAQPYRVAFFYPEGRGCGTGPFSRLSSSSPSASLAVLVTLGFVEDMERHEAEDVDAAR